MTSGTRDAPTAALGRIVGRGMSWSALSATSVKAASFGAQVVLGFLLSESDFGVYAIALSVAAVVMTVRDGGMLELLIQRGADAFASLQGPVFWMALAFNAAIAGALAAAGPVAAQFYSEPDVAPILWVLAGSLILGTPAITLKTKLRIDLRFGLHARLAMFSAIVQYGGVVALAALGFGPLSFVLPLPAVALAEWLILAVATKDAPWRHGAQLGRWLGLLAEVKWLLFGALAMVLARMGDYAVLGRLVPTDVVGVYYFAFQLSVHVGMVASMSIATVLLPALTRVVNEPARVASATLRSLRALSLVASPLSLGLAVVIAPLESLVWGGKWESAVAPVQLLCTMVPIRLSWTIATSLLKARGRFRRWAELAALQGAGLVIVATIAGFADFGPTRIAAVVAAYFVVIVPALLAIAAREVNISVREVLAALLPAWLIALAMGGAVLAADSLWLGAADPAVRFLAGGTGFVLAFTVAARLLVAAHLADLASVLPAALGTPLRRLLWLRSPAIIPSRQSDASPGE